MSQPPKQQPKVYKPEPPKPFEPTPGADLFGDDDDFKFEAASEGGQP